MHYSVKEIFYSLQGEGARSGRPAVFCRFTGCNLWSGEEQHRAQAQCNFCDTDFVGTDGEGGGTFQNPQTLADEISQYWPDLDQGSPYVIFTGGEPFLQLDETLIIALQSIGFEVAVESNGTLAAPEGIDWLCVSPKGQAQLLQRSGDELKLIYPQDQVEPTRFAEMAFEHFYLQPLAGGSDKTEQINMGECVDYCLKHPQWKLSLQTHKTLHIR